MGREEQHRKHYEDPCKTVLMDAETGWCAGTPLCAAVGSGGIKEWG